MLITSFNHSDIYLTRKENKKKKTVQEASSTFEPLGQPTLSFSCQQCLGRGVIKPFVIGDVNRIKWTQKIKALLENKLPAT